MSKEICFIVIKRSNTKMLDVTFYKIYIGHYDGFRLTFFDDVGDKRTWSKGVKEWMCVEVGSGTKLARLLYE